MPWKSWKCADYVLRQLSNCIDLVASDAIYHGQCESFFTKKCILTTKGTETEHAAGHSTNNAMKSNFEKLCKWLNEQTKLFTVSEWASCKNMFICKKYLNVYCLKWMKKQLEQHYQNIFFELGYSKSRQFKGSDKYHIIRTMVQG